MSQCRPRRIRDEPSKLVRILNCGILVVAVQTMAGKPGTLAERFWRKVDMTGGPHECWLWTACRTKKNYGLINIGAANKMILAHRVSYELLHGKIPINMEIDHSCHTSLCVNPAHLRLCTSSENRYNSKRPVNNTSGFKGVSQFRGGWRARIKFKGVEKHIGWFSSPEAAHEAYCREARRLFGSFWFAG